MSLDQRQRQRLAAVRQRANDQHKRDPVGIREDEERRVGLRVHDDSIFLVDCLTNLGGELDKKSLTRVEEIRAAAEGVKEYDPEGVEKNHLAPVRLGVFGDHFFLVELIDKISGGKYKHDKSEPDPDPAPPVLNPESEGIPA